MVAVLMTVTICSYKRWLRLAVTNDSDKHYLGPSPMTVLQEDGKRLSMREMGCCT